MPSQIWLGCPGKFWQRSQRKWSYWALVVSLSGRQEISYMKSSTCPESIHIADSGLYSIAIRLISCVREHNSGLQKEVVPKVNEETVRTSSDPGPFCYWHSAPHGVHVILASIHLALWEWTCNHYAINKTNLWHLFVYKYRDSLYGTTWPKWLPHIQQLI